MKKRKSLKVIAAIALIAIVLSAMGILRDPSTKKASAETQGTELSELTRSSNNYFKGLTYTEYLELNSGVFEGSEEYVFEAKDIGNFKGDVKVEKDPKGSGADVVYTGESSEVSVSFTVPEEGYYSVRINYMPATGNGNDIERTLYLDGIVPYKQAQYFTLTRIWHDAEAIREDVNGNQIRPNQEEVPDWRSSWVYDSGRYSNEPLKFFFTEGEHDITLQAVREPMYIKSIEVKAYKVPKTYSQVSESYAGLEKIDTANNGGVLKIQAENMFEKSDYTLYQSTDRTSAITEPQDSSSVKLNMISGDKFKVAGQWVTWKVNVPKTGLYRIALRSKQNGLSGMYVNRTLLIDGEVPFKEAEYLEFKYSTDWKTACLGDKQNGDFWFYLTEGEHEIGLEVTLGNMAEIIARAELSLANLNAIYRKILLITGATADIYRDYNFQTKLPSAITDMQLQAIALREIIDNIETLVGMKGERTNDIEKLIRQLEKMSVDPDGPNGIAKNFASFKDNIATLATWISTVSAQPLSLDYIMLVGENDKLPRSEANFFEGAAYEINNFIASFFVDYTSLGLSAEVAEKKDAPTIEVWLSSGRDQSNVLRQLINNSFTPKYGINVELKLVAGGTLLPSVLSNQGPDVSIEIAHGTPIQYAIRNAVVDLTKFPDYEEVSKRFYPSALASYEFNGAVYALPESQTFPMLFYRKDILDELGIEVPQTWDDYYEAISIIERNNMQVGFPNGMGGMQIFLYQNGGTIYTPDLKKCTFDDVKTLDAFQRMLDLFVSYKLPRDYDFSNRFRQGIMPLAIQDYTAYNGISAFAPEIKGLWGIAPIPGTPQEDGTINRACACSGTSAIMLSASKHQNEAWEFMKWWTSAEIQSSYAQEMKAILGQSAMHATANIEALASLPWTEEEYSAIFEQWKHVQGTPEIPGNYYVGRTIDFAATKGYSTGMAEELLDWAIETNEEIERKRKEFNLD